MGWEELLTRGVYGVVLAETKEGEKIFKPLNGTCSIVHTVENILKEHPGCRLRYFEANLHPRNFPGVPWDNYY